MSGVDEAVNAVADESDHRQGSRSAGLFDGIFYGAIAYLIGYLWVYINIMNDQIANKVQSVGGFSAENYEIINLLLPSTGEYAGWVYQYALGGSIGVSVNLLPGSYPIDKSLLYPFEGSKQDMLRETILTEPWLLLHPSRAQLFVEFVQSPSEFAALSFWAVTPTVLFIAGYILTSRTGAISPITGAITGSKVTAGFLLASIASTYVFAVSISGFGFGIEQGLSAAVGVEAGITAEVGRSISQSASVQPEISISPSLTRSILVGTIYPLAFGSLGGIAATTLGIIRLPKRLIKFMK